MSKHTRVLLFISLAVVAILLVACNRAKPAAAKRYPFTGKVVSISKQEQSALINGDDIPGFMDAMAMSYKIKPPATLDQLEPGDSIQAEVVVQSEGDAPNDYWLENVKVTAHAKDSPAKSSSAFHTPSPGELVPDFSFTNQSGQRISLKQKRGKLLLVTFIYTRCPFTDFCPRMTGNFAQIYQQMGKNAELADTELLSVSFDPEHDTPKVLRDYGYSAVHTHDASLFSRWEFATASAADLPKIADFFALTVKPEGGLITHNLSTAVIAPDGKIQSWYYGGDWQVSDLIKDAALARASGSNREQAQASNR